MDRRAFVTGGLAAILVPASAGGQAAGKVYRVGVLATPSRIEGLRATLAELGYREGQNLVLEIRSMEGRFERLPALARELVKLGVDVIVASGSESVQAVKDATRSIPIVMMNVGDPVGLGFVASLARPGGTITGVSNIAVELEAKRLELLREADPRIKRVAVLWNPPQRGHRGMLNALEGAAPSLGVTLQLLAVQTANDLESALGAARRERAGGLTVLASTLHSNNFRRIADFARRSRLPAMAWTREFVEVGGLMTYDASDDDQNRRTAVYVDRILKGASPAELPVEQPARFRLVLNLKAARALGLTIPQSLLVRADEVIPP